MSITYYPNKKEAYKARLKNAIRWIIPYWIKTQPIMKLSDDKHIAVELIGYMFGWEWRKWQWAKATGRIFRQTSKQPVTPEDAQDHYARTGEDLLKPKEGNIVVYSPEDFMPYEYEPYMNMKVPRFFLLICLIAWGSIYLSHKIAGPLYRFQVSLEDL